MIPTDTKYSTRTVPILLEGVGGGAYTEAYVTPELLHSVFESVLVPLARKKATAPKALTDILNSSGLGVPLLFQISVDNVLSTYGQAYGRVSAINYLCIRISRKDRNGVEISKQLLWEITQQVGGICLISLNWKYYDDYAVLFLLPRPIEVLWQHDECFHKYTFFCIVQAIVQYLQRNGVHANVRSWPLEKGIPLLLEWNFIHPTVVKSERLPTLEWSYLAPFLHTLS